MDVNHVPLWARRGLFSWSGVWWCVYSDGRQHPPRGHRSAVDVPRSKPESAMAPLPGSHPNHVLVATLVETARFSAGGTEVQPHSHNAYRVHTTTLPQILPRLSTHCWADTIPIHGLCELIHKTLEFRWSLHFHKEQCSS